MILFMTLLSALKLFFHNVRQLSLEEICRAVILDSIAVSMFVNIG